MSFNLYLYRKLGRKKLGEVGLWQTPTNVSKEIVPQWEAEGMEPYYTKYVAWVKSGEDFKRPDVAGLENTLETLVGQGADAEEIVLIAAEIKRLVTSPQEEHIEYINAQIKKYEAEFPDGKWVWFMI